MTEAQKNEKLDLLIGYEVSSLKHEGIVYIKSATKAIVNGQEFNLTNKDISYLFKQMIKESGCLYNA